VPTGTAAAAIYLASLLSGESVEEKDIAKVAGTTPVTIQNRYKELVKKSKFPLNCITTSHYQYFSVFSTAFSKSTLQTVSYALTVMHILQILTTRSSWEPCTRSSASFFISAFASS